MNRHKIKVPALPWLWFSWPLCPPIRALNGQEDKRSLCWKSTNLLDFIFRIWRRKPCPRIPGDEWFGLLEFCIFTFWSLCQPQWWGTFSRSRCACLRWILMSIYWCGRVPTTTLQKWEIRKHFKVRRQRGRYTSSFSANISLSCSLTQTSLMVVKFIFWIRHKSHQLQYPPCSSVQVALNRRPLAS